MFKTEEQVNTRLNSERNLANRFGNVARVPDSDPEPNPGATAPAQVIVPAELVPEPEQQAKIKNTTLFQPGNKFGKKKLAIHQRNEIAIRARLGETQPALAKEFGVSQATIGAIEKGRTKVNEDIIEKRLDDVQDLAMAKLLSSLGYMSNEKMQLLDPVKLSVVARNMSGVIGNIRQKAEEGPSVTIQIYAPEQKNVTSYKTIDV